MEPLLQRLLTLFFLPLLFLLSMPPVQAATTHPGPVVKPDWLMAQDSDADLIVLTISRSD